VAFDLTQLRAFSAIAAAGSLGRAADSLNVTQPALSRTIRRLEERAGAPLFERHSKGVLLTEIGQALLPHAIFLQRESEQAKEEIRAMLGLEQGTVRVGAIASIASLQLPLAIGSVSKKWPNLRIQVIEGVWDLLSSALISHEIDLALGIAREDSEEIVSVKDCHWEDAICVVAGKQHPLRRKHKLTLSDTLNERWVSIPKGTETFHQLGQFFARHDLPLPNVVVQTRSVTALKGLVGRSGFLAWIPEPLFEAERKAGWIDTLKIPDSIEKRRLTAFHRRAGALPSPAVKLLEELRALIAQASPSQSPRDDGRMSVISR
jgi:DNA-binding transcriptional LysR family regulator